MRTMNRLGCALLVSCLIWPSGLVSGGTTSPGTAAKDESESSAPLTAERVPAQPQTPPEEGRATDTAKAPDPAQQDPSPDAVKAPAAGNQIRWQVCVPAGGSTASVSSRIDYTVGQPVVGLTSSATARLRSGFWQQFRARCPILISGDVNLSSSVTSADIIFMVNHVFKGASAPQPCPAAGDVNCSGILTSADIIYLVNHVFKGAAAPCDGCTSSLAAGC